MNKEELLAQLTAPKTKAVSVGGQDYTIRAMTLRQRDQYDALRLSLPKNADGSLKSMAGLRSFLVAACVCDDTGVRIFSDVDIPDIEESTADLSELANEIGLFNRLYGAPDDEKN